MCILHVIFQIPYFVLICHSWLVEATPGPSSNIRIHVFYMNDNIVNTNDYMYAFRANTCSDKYFFIVLIVSWYVHV